MFAWFQKLIFGFSFCLEYFDFFLFDKTTWYLAKHNLKFTIFFLNLE